MQLEFMALSHTPASFGLPFLGHVKRVLLLHLLRGCHLAGHEFFLRKTRELIRVFYLGSTLPPPLNFCLVEPHELPVLFILFDPPFLFPVEVELVSQLFA